MLPPSLVRHDRTAGGLDLARPLDVEKGLEVLQRIRSLRGREPAPHHGVEIDGALLTQPTVELRLAEPVPRAEPAEHRLLVTAR